MKVRSAGLRLDKPVAVGVGESMVASAATFAAGLYATRELPLVELGAYGILFFGLLLIVSGLSNQLYFTPAELALLELPDGVQLRSLRRSLRRGILLTLPAAIVIGAGVRLLLGDELPVGMLVTGVVMGTLSPNQDHLRRILHQTGHSGAALGVSVTQFTVLLAVIGGGVVADAPAAWIPMGSLAAANLCSLVVGLVTSRRWAIGVVTVPPLKELVDLGGWLVVAYQAEQIAGFAALVVLRYVAGTDAVGWYEGARLLAQPMMVLAFGLQTVLRPRAMRAATAGDAATGREVDRTFSAVLAAAAVGYAILIGPAWPVNPLPQLFPAAYHVSGAVVLMVVATSLQNSTSLFSSQIVAARRTRDLVRLSVPNAPLIPLVTAALAAPWGTNAVAVAVIVERTVWYLRYRPIHRRIFAGPAAAPANGTVPADLPGLRSGEPAE